ncbi:MAG: glycine cleavage system protein GcvH [Ardenticatenia bacterium]|nr:glycine cleavage system protein GcvH [Ardenticatenia bacterium]
MNVPADLLYTDEHEWVRLEGDVTVVGITDYAQHELGDVVYVELPEVGERITQHAPFGVVESVKAASDLFAPISGEVIEINTRLADAPELVNTDPYGEGWMIKVRPDNWETEHANLLNADAYRRLIEQE